MWSEIGAIGFFKVSIANRHGLANALIKTQFVLDTQIVARNHNFLRLKGERITITEDTLSKVKASLTLFFWLDFFDLTFFYFWECIYESIISVFLQDSLECEALINIDNEDEEKYKSEYTSLYYSSLDRFPFENITIVGCTRSDRMRSL